MRDMDLPFARQTPTDVTLEDPTMSGGLVILAAAVPVPEHGTLPALVYRFAKPDGSGFYPPFVLSLSWLAIILAAAELLTSSQVHEEQGEK